MNFKKIIFLACIPLLFSLDSNCMQRPRQRPVEKTAWNKIVTTIQKPPILYFTIIDYLVQLCSIYSIDSKNEQVVSHLPKARALINCFRIGSYLNSLYNSGLKNLNLAKALGLFDSAIRGYNISRDYNIWKNTDSIVSKNKERKDSSLNKKKLYHYLWLTLNNFGPLAVNQLGNKVSFELSWLLANFSELYRQKLMYDLIENKQKLA